jgi:ferrochelatase
VKGIILMAYGAPRSPDEVETYYTHIRGGRKPSQAELANLVERYEAIGGTSPLIRITEGQRDRLQERLRLEGCSTRVYSAMKHSRPFIAEVIGKAAEDGVDELLAIALAPHYSKMSVGSYMLSVEGANAALPKKMKLDFVFSWHRNPKLIEAWASRIRRAEGKVPNDYSLIFSAHSLPERILAEGDPYKDQLLDTSGLIAGKIKKEGWSFSFQSASHTNEPWLWPDILDHLQALVGKGKRSFLIAPIGFVSDHLEILYDIDVECRRWADDAGVALERCESLNNSNDFVECLYSLILEKHFL